MVVQTTHLRENLLMYDCRFSWLVPPQCNSILYKGLRHNCICPDCNVVSQMDIANHFCSSCNKAVISYNSCLTVFPCRANCNALMNAAIFSNSGCVIHNNSTHRGRLIAQVQSCSQELKSRHISCQAYINVSYRESQSS